MDASMPYNGAITREQFLVRETRVVAQLKTDENLTNEQIVERVTRLNLFHYPTERELKSISKACCRRLDALSDDPSTRDALVRLIAHGMPEEVRQANLYALMRTFRVAWEFMVTVVGPRYRSFDPSLPRRDIASFLEQLRTQDERVAGWSDATMNKIRQVLTSALVECAMYDRKTETLQPVFLGVSLEQGIRANGDEVCLPAFNCLI